MKNTKFIIAAMLATAICFASPAYSLEYQWKYIIPTMDEPEKKVKVFEIVNDIIGVYDVTMSVDTNSLMLFYDDEKTDEEAIEKVLNEAGFPVKRMMLLKEPREGVMG